MWGVDLSMLSPSDAAVALRGLERRYRELFELLGEDESPDELAHRRTAHGWSVIDHIAAAAQGIAAANRALARVLIAETPTVQPDEVDLDARPTPAIGRASVDELLAALGQEVSAAADRIESVPARELVPHSQRRRRLGPDHHRPRYRSGRGWRRRGPPPCGQRGARHGPRQVRLQLNVGPLA
jgi:hypothetical protein